MKQQIKQRLKLLQNEQGMAFLFALLAMGFVTVFASFLLSSAQTASLQADKVNGQLDARLIAEAGVDFYHAELRRAMNDTVTGEVIDVRLPPSVTHALSDTHSFTIEDISSSLNGNNLTVSFTSTGQSESENISIKQQTTITQ